ncbi:maltokinase N-terminal cap-like domain-containing protein [Streptomyces sp. WI04-05B]|uniref:maltokinase N-terminal cap-like domain-containing protein n=1 Tax=Streptomyces TaxID=1883 RepID=UPI0029A0175F|nr:MULTISPECIES: 1,4-alpha-glucan branching protein [unclassified Streptomyces]MDX2542367.1 1,4-alpha-glucan branching protein [Streptomyces sp. WI04-05B]MDX2584199.1 1,4-alpha-glucan branching protein [Streptomyces sp. WI04-05A]
MAVIHNTTMSPGKLELLTAWLPTRPWYVASGREPELTKAGGFRLDDPAGEVGIEFMVVTDASGDAPVSYHVPLSYRDAPLGGADQALVGTSEHGVLGKRWIYDGAHDPVLVAQLLALLQGRAEAQAQSVSGAPDLSVTGRFRGAGLAAEVASLAVTDGQDGTAVVVGTGADSGPGSTLTLRVTRVLPAPEERAEGLDTAGARGQVTAGWRLPDGSESRAPFVLVGDAPR